MFVSLSLNLWKKLELEKIILVYQDFLSRGEQFISPTKAPMKLQGLAPQFHAKWYLLIYYLLKAFKASVVTWSVEVSAFMRWRITWCLSLGSDVSQSQVMLMCFGSNMICMYILCLKIPTSNDNNWNVWNQSKLLVRKDHWN